MIYTVTPNPSLDYYLAVDSVALNETNRATEAVFVYGGKGINVACVCKNLKLNALALGFSGGFTGEELERLLKSEGIPYDFVRISGCTRVNVKCGNGRITEINAPGSPVTAKDVDALCERLQTAKNGDTVVLSGSQPPCEIHNIFAYIMKKLSQRGISFIVDTCGEALRECLEFMPELIKPNYRELCGLFGKTDIPYDELPEYARQLTAYGARSVLVSLGECGAMLFDSDKAEYQDITDIGLAAINPTGAGDSMIAGYLYAKQHKLPLLQYATAAGSASAYSKGLCEYSLMDKIAAAIKH